MEVIRVANWVKIDLLVLAAGMLAACRGAGPVPTRSIVPASTLRVENTSASPTAGRIPPSIPTQTAITIPIPAASAPPPAAIPSPTPETPRNLGMSVLAGGFREPDDLYLVPDGSVYVSDVSAGTVSRTDSGGRVTRVVSGLSSPEGILQLPDGTLVVAEQGKNRLVRIDPASGQESTFLALENRTGQMGVDGIALDSRPPGPPSVIIPDSPNGTVLRASLDGKTVSTLAKGFDRPTGAWVEPDGSILVADENAGALVRLRADGSRQVLARLALADDVVEDAAGNIFAISISAGTVHWVRPDGEDAVLVVGLSSPQGICLDADGNLLVAESGRQRVVRIKIHG